MKHSEQSPERDYEYDVEVVEDLPLSCTEEQEAALRAQFEQLKGLVEAAPEFWNVRSPQFRGSWSFSDEASARVAYDRLRGTFVEAVFLSFRAYLADGDGDGLEEVDRP